METGQWFTAGASSTDWVSVYRNNTLIHTWWWQQKSLHLVSCTFIRHAATFVHVQQDLAKVVATFTIVSDHQLTDSWKFNTSILGEVGKICYCWGMYNWNLFRDACMWGIAAVRTKSPQVLRQEFHWCTSQDIPTAKNSLAGCLNHSTTPSCTSLSEANICLWRLCLASQRHENCMVLSRGCMQDVWLSPQWTFLLTLVCKF